MTAIRCRLDPRRHHRRSVHPPGRPVRGLAGAAQPGRPRLCWSRRRARGRTMSPSMWRAGRARSCAPSRRRVRRAEGLDATEAMLAEARRLARRGGRAPTSPGTGATSMRCPSPTAPSTSSAAASPSITWRRRRGLRRDGARLPPRRPRRAVRCRGRPTIRPRPPPSTPWSATAIPRRWSSARSASAAASSATPACASRRRASTRCRRSATACVAMSFPAGDDRAGLRAMIDASVDGRHHGRQRAPRRGHGAVRVPGGGAGGGQVGVRLGSRSPGIPLLLIGGNEGLGRITRSTSVMPILIHWRSSTERAPTFRLDSARTRACDGQWSPLIAVSAVRR